MTNRTHHHFWSPSPRASVGQHVQTVSCPNLSNLSALQGTLPVAVASLEVCLFVLREIPPIQILRFLGLLVLAILHRVINVTQHSLDGIWLRKVQRQERHEGVIFDLWSSSNQSLGELHLRSNGKLTSWTMAWLSA